MPNICQQLNMSYAPPLMARGAAACATPNIVRRLTPTECERLQGLPDGWTAGGSDTKRYKALGNGMAQPIADWILKRIVEESHGRSD
ncbi:MAG: DNA cytosine methyltransferase [Selenomonadaceae bacterium]|nr:DNA cytosine methyltransferase [Selenomonadaceae bacterium]MBQ3434254.1 DNA cytosine methyltransferase [Selenomonadaceae bacterium]